MQNLTLTKPDDWHIHLRDDEHLATTVDDASRQFSRAIVMPNLLPPVTDIETALAYKKRILHHLKPNRNFTPLMTLYLTDGSTPELIKKAKASGFIYACKLYPMGATTHSDAGVSDIKNLYPVFAAMDEVGMPLLLHGEVTNPQVDVFDREKVFIDSILTPIVKKFSTLKVVLEHITTKEAVKFVLNAPDNVAATITAHHLLLNRNDIFKGGINPHYYCLPILKRDIHQQALLKAATSSNPKFFLGTDSAPHAVSKKQCTHGCAGIYTAHAAIELYATAFARVNALANLEGFASFHGADFYGLERNTDKITLVHKPWRVPETIRFGEELLRPMWAGCELEYKILE